MTLKKEGRDVILGSKRAFKEVPMGKTNYIKQIVDDYCVLDTETTGLSAYYDEIIEIGILRVRDNQIVARYSQLIKPEEEIDLFITSLTGITNKMLEGMPSIKDVKENVLSFLGNDIILGHNTSFDMRFLYQAFDVVLENKYMDTMQFCRKVFPELKHHTLSFMADYLNLTNNEHRAMADCITTKELYDSIKKVMAERGLKIEDLWVKLRSHDKRQLISDITAESENIDPDGFFYNKHVVFTGKLEKMLRQEAMQMVVNRGGILDTGITKKTDYLILGDNDYNAILHGEKSSKHKKAEQLIMEGCDILIIDELTFYDLMEEDTDSE